MIKINLLRLLKERGMTQLELSEITGIRPSTICGMCNNNCAFLKIENIDKICCKLNCRIENFIEIVPSEERTFNESIKETLNKSAVEKANR